MKSKFRADIEGLRAIAVGAVVLCHAGLPFAGGGYIGVDVFFVISGFLITGLILREIEKTGKVSFRDFYTRRMRRLLPLSFLVLLVVAIGSLVWFSSVRSQQVSGDIFTAALYVVNWRFAAQSIDYFAEGLAASPVQHYWSLSIEEQFYLVWPTVILLATWFWRRRGGNIRPALGVTIGVITLASLAWSIVLTERSGEAAYFASLTRFWEMGAGGALALLVAWQLRGWLVQVLAVGGLAAIIAGVVFYDASTPFPGYAALLPVLGTAALIWAGAGNVRPLTNYLLELRPVRFIGRISYAWYLWHWPPVIFAAQIWGPLSVFQGVVVITLSLIPTIISHYLVERPLHRNEKLRLKPRLAIGMWLGGTAAVGLAALALVTLPSTIGLATPGEVEGAAALAMQSTPQESAPNGLRPTPDAAIDDTGPWRKCHQNFRASDVRTDCVLGDPDADFRVMAFGDSHIQQWTGALKPLIAERDWSLDWQSKSACPPAAFIVHNDNLPGGRRYTECEKWREGVLERIETTRPDLVLVGTYTGYPAFDDGDSPYAEPDPWRQVVEDGMVETLERIKAAAGRVVVVQDIPGSEAAGVDVADCIASNPDNFAGCGFAAADSKIAGLPHAEAAFDAAAAGRTGAGLIDMTPWICPDGYCRAVIGDMIVIRDRNHITATYAASLAPRIGEELDRLGLPGGDTSR